jgi:hypothetical protein
LVRIAFADLGVRELQLGNEAQTEPLDADARSAQRREPAMTSPATSGQRVVGDDLQPGDRITYWRSGGIYLRRTKTGMCVIMLDARSRTSCVRRTSITLDVGATTLRVSP